MLKCAKKPVYIYVTLQLRTTYHHSPKTIHKFTIGGALRWISMGCEEKSEALSRCKAKEVAFEHQGAYVISQYPINYNDMLSFDSPLGKEICYRGLDFSKPHSIDEKGRLLLEVINWKSHDMSHYKAMAAESAGVGWPTSYLTDLEKHDYVQCQYTAPEKAFGWILRESGTHYVPLAKVNTNGGFVGPGKAYYAIMGQIYKDPNTACKWYIWESGALTSYKAEVWRDRMDYLFDSV